MKRALTMLGAIAALVLGSFIAAPAANAQTTVVCDPVTGGTGVWPWGGATKFCHTGSSGATQANGAAVANALNSILSADSSAGDINKAAGHILKNWSGDLGTGARFFVFGTPAHFSSYCSGHWTEFGYTSAAACSSYNAGVFGVTEHNPSTGKAKFTVIFTSELSNPGWAGYTLGGVAAHEAGHWLNGSPEWRTLLGAGTGVLASDSANFQQNLNKDYDLFNQETPPCPTIFGGSKDTFLIYICSGTGGTGSTLNSGYSLPNELVLKRAWFHFYNPNEYTAYFRIGGTVSAGDTVSIKITDPTVLGSPKTYFFNITSSSTTKAQIAAGLVAAMNADTALLNKLYSISQGDGTAGTTAADVVILTRTRGFVTYSVSVTGPQRTETITPSVFSSPGFYPSNGEFFSQLFESTTSSKWNGAPSPNKVLTTNAYFKCTKQLMLSLRIYGQVPGRPGSVMPWPSLGAGNGTCYAF
jgi:hypothetical protein